MAILRRWQPDAPSRGRDGGRLRLWIAAAVTLAPMAGAAIGAAPPATSAAESECSVSALLVPSCGAWFGASTASADGSYDYSVGLAEYEAVVDTRPAILHFYKRDGAVFPTATERSLATRPGGSPAMLFYNWKPSTTLSWARIAAGEADANIAATANGLKAYDGRLFLTVYHEPEDNVIDTVGSGFTPADYVAMFRHTVTRLRALGVNNVVYVMNYMGFARWAPLVDRLYPGDDVVDWVAYDPYGFAAQPTIREILNSPSSEWPGFYVWATTTHPGKPLMVAEWGIDVPTQPAAPDIVRTAGRIIAVEFPAIKAFVYWNDAISGFQVRVDQTPEYSSAFAELAADPYFAQTAVPVQGGGGSPQPPTTQPPTTQPPTTQPPTTQPPTTQPPTTLATTTTTRAVTTNRKRKPRAVATQRFEPRPSRTISTFAKRSTPASRTSSGARSARSGRIRVVADLRRR